MRTGATFRVHGLEAADVSRVLGIDTPAAPDEPWRLSVEPADDTELSVPIESLLDVLDQLSDGLRELRSAGATFDLFCYLGSSALEHCAILEPAVLRRIADVPAALWLDLYPDEECCPPQSPVTS